LHAHWSAREPLHLRLVPARLGALARAWDDAYRLGVVRERALARAAALGVLGKAEGIVDAFFAEVADDLADLSEESGVSVAEALAAAATRAKEGASAAEGAPADP